MNTLLSPNQPWLLLLQNHQLGNRASTIKPMYPSFSKCRSMKVYAEGKSRGFPGRSKQEEEPKSITKPPTANDDDELPPVVINRMIRRILAYVGFPMGVGLGLLSLFGYLRDNHIEVPIWVVFVTTFFAFGCSALGVPFGALSTNWDPNEEGSLLGFKEVSYNWVKMWEDDS